MSNIFGGVEPPRWLQEIARPADMDIAAKDIGMAFGGALLAMERDPEAKPVYNESTGQYEQPRKGFKKGLTEARLNQADPNWRLKEKALESQAVSNYARTASAWQQYNTNNRELAAWTTHDLPSLYKYRDDLKADPSAIPPIMESTQGAQALGKIQTGLAQASVAKTSSQTFQKMVQGLAEKGGAAAVMAGKYTSFIGKVPPPNVLDQFGKDLAQLGITESSLLEKTRESAIQSGASVTTTIGPKGVTETFKSVDTKPLSPLGKLQADYDAAIKSGAPKNVLDAYKAEIETRPSATDSLYSKNPEIIEVEGPDGNKLSFLRWGRQLRDLNNVNVAKKIEIDLAKSHFNRLDAELIKHPRDKDIKNAHISARMKLNRLLGSTPIAKPTQIQPQPTTATESVTVQSPTQSTTVSSSSRLPAPDGGPEGEQPNPAQEVKRLTKEIADEFMIRAKGNRRQAEIMAAEAGYTW